MFVTTTVPIPAENFCNHYDMMNLQNIFEIYGSQRVGEKLEKLLKLQGYSVILVSSLI